MPINEYGKKNLKSGFAIKNLLFNGVVVFNFVGYVSHREQ